jgi:exodeoxyribonuclease-3
VGETHVTAPERERFAALLEAGAVDAFRSLHPDEPGFTWWDYRAGHFHKKMGLRIDAILLAPALAERLQECGIDRNFRKGPKPSDHAPLLAELR